MRRRAAGGAAMILVAGVLAGCGRPEATGASLVRSGPLAALPRETVGLVVLEVGALRDVEPVERWLRDLPARAGEEGLVREVERAFGPGMLEKLHRLALAIVPLGADAMGYAIVAQGAFDEAALRRSLGGSDVLTLLEVDGRPDFSVAVLDGGTLALGARSLLEVVRRNAGRRGAGLDGNRRLLDLLARVRPPSQVWGAIDYAPMARLVRRAVEGAGVAGLSASPGPAEGVLQSVAFQGTLSGQSVAYDLLGQASGEPGARQLADAARGLVSLARMAVSQDASRAWFQILDAIRVEQEGIEVRVHGSIPPEALGELAGGAPGAPAAREAPPGTAGPPVP